MIYKYTKSDTSDLDKAILEAKRFDRGLLCVGVSPLVIVALTLINCLLR